MWLVKTPSLDHIHTGYTCHYKHCLYTEHTQDMFTCLSVADVEVPHPDVRHEICTLVYDLATYMHAYVHGY
jgi:hypothetical protein